MAAMLNPAIDQAIHNLMENNLIAEHRFIRHQKIKAVYESVQLLTIESGIRDFDKAFDALYRIHHNFKEYEPKKAFVHLSRVKQISQAAVALYQKCAHQFFIYSATRKLFFAAAKNSHKEVSQFIQVCETEHVDLRFVKFSVRFPVLPHHVTLLDQVALKSDCDLLKLVMKHVPFEQTVIDHAIYSLIDKRIQFDQNKKHFNEKLCILLGKDNTKELTPFLKRGLFDLSEEVNQIYLFCFSGTLSLAGSHGYIKEFQQKEVGYAHSVKKWYDSKHNPIAFEINKMRILPAVLCSLIAQYLEGNHFKTFIGCYDQLLPAKT